MNLPLLRTFLFIALLGLLTTVTKTLYAQTSAVDLKVVSFNIRYGTAADGDNHWDKRREFVIDTIKTIDPDLLGTQETMDFQRDYLAQELRDYECLGVGRDDGREAGEMMALYYRPSRFERLSGGHFWLSETPDVVGSKSWDSSLPRMVTWVKLRDKKHSDAPNLLFLNTHFDHRGPTARLESAKLIRAKVRELGAGCLVVVTGDFNADQGSDPYNALFLPVDGQESPVVDSFRSFYPDRQANEGTFSGFKVSEVKGPRIDWIGCSRGFMIQSAEIDRTSRDGRTPSDHFPVIAALNYRKQ